MSAVERADWLARMQAGLEALYDHLAPQYWVTYGVHPNETHIEFMQGFLDCIPQGSFILSAGCGAGRYDGILLGAGHRVFGIDQSARMLDRARQRFPQVHYERLRLQEMEFHREFDGAICIDAMEHVFPEDWPAVLRRLRQALKPGGLLYLTVVRADGVDLDGSYRRAIDQGLPVVMGEVADAVEEAASKALETPTPSAEQSDAAAYHFYPRMEEVRGWLDGAGLGIESEDVGTWYRHLLLKRLSHDTAVG